MKRYLPILLVVAACADEGKRLPCGAHETNDWGGPALDYRYAWDDDGHLIDEEWVDADGAPRRYSARYESGQLVHYQEESDRLLKEWDVTLREGHPDRATFTDHDDTDAYDHTHTMEWTWDGADNTAWTMRYPGPDLYDLIGTLRWIDGGYQVDTSSPDSMTDEGEFHRYLGPSDFLGDDTHWTRYELHDELGLIYGIDRTFDANGEILVEQYFNDSDGVTSRMEYTREPDGTPLRRVVDHQTGYRTTLEYLFTCSE